MASESSMDDLFATFLEEVEEADPQTAAKRARTCELQDSSAERSTTAAALRKAAYLGQLTKVQMLLQGLSPVERLLLIDDLDSDDGFAALHLAVINGHEAVVRALLHGRADVDCLTAKGDTALMWAASSGSKPLCKLLLRGGADISLRSHQGRNASKQAEEKGFGQIKELLESHSNNAVTGASKGPRGKLEAGDAAAAARRAANMAAVEAALKAERERKEEEEFWAQVRARREGRGETEKDLFKTTAASMAARAKTFEDVREEPSLPPHLRDLHVRGKHYQLLGIQADAAEDDVRKAYRKLALRHHPDKNPEDTAGAKQRFTEVALAYEAVCEHLASCEQGAKVPPPPDL